MHQKFLIYIHSPPPPPDPPPFFPSLFTLPSLPPSSTPPHAQHRFIVFHVEFRHGCERKFDVHGKEIEPNFGQMGLVRTGYLHSSYSE